jgi:hypothetical protein
MPQPSRRSILHAAGAMAAPIILGAANKSGSARPMVGSGAYRYEVIHDWGELPAQIRYGNTHGVCEDAQGHIYIHHTVDAASESADSMVVFDARAKFVKSWGREFKGGAHGLHIRKEGSTEYLYLCDTKRALVVKTTLAGEEVFTLGYPKESPAYPLAGDGKPAKKYSPTNLAIAPNGDIYVADGYGSSYINQYSAKAGFVRTFGGKGKEAGQLDCPHGIAVDLRDAPPTLLVADRANRRIQRFSLAGEHLGFVNGVSMPCHFHEHNGVVVVPELDARVTLLDRENGVIERLGDDNAANTWGALRKEPREKFAAGKFVCPHGACFDRSGNIFVVEWVEAGRVTKLRHVS